MVLLLGVIASTSGSFEKIEIQESNGLEARVQGMQIRQVFARIPPFD